MRKSLILVTALLPTFAQAEDVVIAALGDSLTQGYGLPEAEGFVPQLQNWLDEAEIDARIINAGVSGDTTAGGLSRVDWTLTPDVDGMIVALGGNDLLRGIDPSVSRANLEGILKAAEAEDVPVLLVGMQAPGNFGPDYKQEFDAIYPELAASFETVYAESFFKGLGVEQGDPASVRPFMQSDGIHPNADGVEQIVSTLGPYVAELIARSSP